jgi:hypothetical protein
MKLQNSFNFKTGPIVIEVTSNHEVDVIWLHDRYHHMAFAGGFLTHTQYEVPFGSKVHDRLARTTPCTMYDAYCIIDWCLARTTRTTTCTHFMV